MAWNLETAKQYLGITDDSQDALVQKTMDEVIATVELFLQRTLFYGVETAVYYGTPQTGELLLRRYPVTQVNTIKVNDNETTPTDLLVHYSAGLIESYEFRARRKVSIEYAGGYTALPMDLEKVLYEILLEAWGNIDQTTGGPSTGAGTVGTGEVSSVTLNDFMSVKFDTALSSGGNDPYEEAAGTWGWLAPWYPVLQMYRSENGVGVGMA